MCVQFQIRIKQTRRDKKEKLLLSISRHRSFLLFTVAINCFLPLFLFNFLLQKLPIAFLSARALAL
jgi:hypothetical protein